MTWFDWVGVGCFVIEVVGVGAYCAALHRAGMAAQRALDEDWARRRH